MKERKALRELANLEKFRLTNRGAKEKRDAAIKRNIALYGRKRAITIAIYIEKKRKRKWFWTMKDLHRWDKARERRGWFNPWGTGANTPVE